MNEELFPKGLSSVARPILTAILSTNPSSAKLQQVLKPKKIKNKHLVNKKKSMFEYLQ